MSNDYLSLRTAIEQALTGLIGTYTYSATRSTPAIRVDLGVAAKPGTPQPTVTGLEVLIVPSAEVAVKPVMGGYKESTTTRIVLKQWDVTKSVVQAMDRLVSVLPNIDRIVRIMRMTELDNIETCTITLTDIDFVQHEQ